MKSYERMNPLIKNFKRGIESEKSSTTGLFSLSYNRLHN